MSDLTGYASLLGESFDTRIDLLERVIKSSHYPSLGRYKERLLARVIRDYIPRNFDVGTGFVLFPHEHPSPAGGISYHDPRNQSAFAVSRQCDILVYDSNTVPPVFRDEDFVVLRPEAIRAVIEVKGSLTSKDMDSTLESFYDFGCKWRTTQLFYKSRHQGLVKTPPLYVMGWRIQTRQNGRATTDPAKIRQKIAEFYKNRLQLDTYNGFPILNSVFIYKECEISRSLMPLKSEDGASLISEGWQSIDGRFIRFDSQQSPYRGGDRTIASLLAGLHFATSGQTFNRFFSYLDETRESDLVPYQHRGFSAWIDDIDRDSNFKFSDTI